MKQTSKILLIILLNSIIVVSELVFGFISHSAALIAEAFHNMGDVLGLIVTYVAMILATKSPSFKFTYGYIKAETMAAFLNSLILIIAMVYVIYEGITGFLHPEKIAPEYMIVVGLIALLANGYSAYLLTKMGVEHHNDEHEDEHEHEEHDLNIKSAYLHMLSDALISLAVIFAGIVIYFYEIYSIDSILSIAAAAYISFHSYPILKKSFLSLMDVNDSNITPEEIENIITSEEEVLEFHDLHIHTPNSKSNHMTFHLIFKNEDISIKEAEEVILKIKQKLIKKGFNHIIVQPDSHTYIKGQNSSSCVHYT